MNEAIISLNNSTGRQAQFGRPNKSAIRKVFDYEILWGSMREVPFISFNQDSIQKMFIVRSYCGHLCKQRTVENDGTQASYPRGTH